MIGSSEHGQLGMGSPSPTYLVTPTYLQEQDGCVPEEDDLDLCTVSVSMKIALAGCSPRESHDRIRSIEFTTRNPLISDGAFK